LPARIAEGLAERSLEIQRFRRRQIARGRNVDVIIFLAVLLAIGLFVGEGSMHYVITHWRGQQGLRCRKAHYEEGSDEFWGEF
jgi:hypothetical protein